MGRGSRLQSCIAQYNIIAKQSLQHRSFAEDASDVLCALNDNDFYGFQGDPDGNPVKLTSRGYETIRRRKSRQYKGIIKEHGITRQRYHKPMLQVIRHPRQAALEVIRKIREGEFTNCS